MDISPVSALTANNPIRVIRDETEVAARHFVYKLYDTTDGQPMQWQILHGMRESAATISWAGLMLSTERLGTTATALGYTATLPIPTAWKPRLYSPIASAWYTHSA